MDPAIPGAYEVDHVISLKELNHADADAVQRWRSLAMWDPMPKASNRSKGSGYLVCLSSNSPQRRYFHAPSNNILSEDDPHCHCEELRVRLRWVDNRENLLSEHRNKVKSRCCGPCAILSRNLNFDELSDDEKNDVQLYYISQAYFRAICTYLTTLTSHKGL